MNLRLRRENRAARHLEQKGVATSVDLAAAATIHEGRLHADELSSIGAKIGKALVKRGVARLERENLFIWEGTKM